MGLGSQQVRQAQQQRQPLVVLGQSTSAKIRTYLRGETITTEDALQRLVNVPTPTHEVEALEGLGRWLTGQFRQIGFSVRDIPRVDVGNVRYFKNHEQDTNDVLLLAHLDTATVEPPVRFRVEGNRIYGTGVAECKGGIVVALAALRFARCLRRLRVGVLLTSDGVRNGAAARQLVEEAARESRHVIGLRRPTWTARSSPLAPAAPPTASKCRAAAGPAANPPPRMPSATSAGACSPSRRSTTRKVASAPPSRA